MFYKTMTPRVFRNFTLFLLLFLCLLSISAFLIGPRGVLWFNQQHQAILFYRLQRIVLAIIAGSSLAASGASLQALFRNPLADPHLFGISGGASLGAALAICFFSSTTWFYPNIGALLGGLIVFLIVFIYVKKSHLRSLSSCLLLGILINSLTASLITLLKTILPPLKTQNLLFWLVGHIGTVELSHFYCIIPAWIFGLYSLFHVRGELELLSFGRTETILLGIDIKRVITLAIIANCILIGTVVTFAGMIGFIGLIIPHFIRLTLFSDTRFVLPTSAIIGAITLVLFDTLSRMSFFIWQTEIPVGALCSVFLSPVFFFLLVRGWHEH